ncbi:efflux transporter outer membrane subunit [Paraburkholderia xenovorans]
MQPRSTKIVFVTLIAVANALMAGCASFNHTGPESSRIDPATLDAGAAIRNANAEAQWPSQQWWHALGDPQLNGLVERSLDKNPTLAVVQARVREAEAAADLAHASLYPRVDGSMALGRKHFPDNTYYGPGAYNHTTTWNNTAGLSLSYNLDLWGRDHNALLRSLDASHAAATDERAAAVELQSNVVRTYLTLSLSFALRDIAVSTLEQQEHIASIAQRRLAGGIGTRLDLSQAVAPLPEFKRQIQVYDQTIALTRNQLAALTGDGPGFGESITRPVLSLATHAQLPSNLPAELVGRRPDVVAAKWMVAAQARGIDVAKAQFYPNVNLMASITQMAAGGTFLTFLHPEGTGWMAGPAITLPIFDGGALRAQLGAASAQYDEAISRYNAVLISALKDISDQVVNVRSFDAQAEDSADSVAAAQDSYQLADKGYRRGLTDYPNVLTAQMQLLKAREGQAHVQASQLQAYASLQTALGGGAEIAFQSPNEKQMTPSDHLTPFGFNTSSKPGEK